MRLPALAGLAILPGAARGVDLDHRCPTNLTGQGNPSHKVGGPLGLLGKLVPGSLRTVPGDR